MLLIQDWTVVVSSLPVCLCWLVGRSCLRLPFGKQWGKGSTCGQRLKTKWDAENTRLTKSHNVLTFTSNLCKITSFTYTRNCNKSGRQAHYWRDWVKQAEFKIRDVPKFVHIEPVLGFEFIVSKNYTRKTISTS